MKAGTRLRSAVCDTEVMVIKLAHPVDILCGGAPMVAERSGTSGKIDVAFANGTRIGKRYQNVEGTVELLCVKAGQGSVSIDGVVLTPKEAKPLPSSD